MKYFFQNIKSIAIFLAFIYNGIDPPSGEASFEPWPEGSLC
jgi:hypothetical protein